MLKNSTEQDQTLRFAASGLVMHCLPMSHERDARLTWVNPIDTVFIILVCLFDWILYVPSIHIKGRG